MDGNVTARLDGAQTTVYHKTASVIARYGGMKLTNGNAKGALSVTFTTREGDSESTCGDTATIRQLARFARNAPVYGNGFMESAYVDQWIEFAMNELMASVEAYKPGKKGDTSKLAAALKILNGHLLSRTFLVGDYVTAADILIALSVEKVLDFAKSSKFNNVIRWQSTVVAQPQFSDSPAPAGDGSFVRNPKIKRWQEPSRKGKYITGLKVYNSLTNSVVDFVPENGREVTWYICGPTVYDDSHMGHARNYVTFDIIHRIMKDYFKYNVTQVMNVTDIDDKIIMRSNERKIAFTDLAAKYEQEFINDMRILGVEMPAVLTRVSEYVPEIVDYIAKIISNGFAYESNGSVYFDVMAYNKKHFYAKLEPNSVTDASKLAEGEGALSAGTETEKRSPRDFALWKKSKPSEPFWDSPWGKGRPGWHIECSAMASDILGKVIDVHSGGEDLKFPHHDNELAQSEAYFGNQQWINYFLHSGHLCIANQKMSKSLKNFTSIKQALQIFTARQIRMLFLLHAYDNTMDYGEGGMEDAVNIEKAFGQYFMNTKALLRKLASEGRTVEAWGEPEKTLHRQLVNAKTEVHDALCNNFGTQVAMKVLLELTKNVNVYVNKQESPREMLIKSIAQYITGMFKVFGLIDDSDDIGFKEAGGNSEENLAPVLDAFTAFRLKVRNAARDKDLGGVLSACDAVRDDDLPLLGVRLEDKGESSVWKLDDKDTLLKERERKIETARKKEEARLAKEKAKKEKEEKAKIPPAELFRRDPQYEGFTFDDKGIPIKDKTGKDVAKAQIKKLQKLYATQEKDHNKYLESQK